MCLICKDNNNVKPLFCEKCVSYGFHATFSNIRPFEGIPNEELIIHRIYSGGELTEHKILNIIETSNKTFLKTIVWVDKDKYYKHQSFFKNYKQITVKTIESALEEYVNDKTKTYLSREIRIKIISVITLESSGIYKKLARATTFIRLIVLQLYGGLYLDCDIKVVDNQATISSMHSKKFLLNSMHNNKYLKHEKLPVGIKSIEKDITAIRYTMIPYYLVEDWEKPTRLLESFHPQDDPEAIMSRLELATPDCSAIISNRGAFFFDLTLYDMLDRFTCYQKYYTRISIPDKKYPSIIPFLPQNRIALIINSMYTAQFLIIFKKRRTLQLSGRDFVFTRVESYDPIWSEIRENQKYIDLEISTCGYQPQVWYFRVLGIHFVKFFTLSHQARHIEQIAEWPYSLQRALRKPI